MSEQTTDEAMRKSAIELVLQARQLLKLLQKMLEDYPDQEQLIRWSIDSQRTTIHYLEQTIKGYA
jgi:hypothetical protein